MRRPWLLLLLTVIARPQSGASVIARPQSGRSNRAAQQAQDSARSTRSGVYSARQATEGGTLYALNCVNCHTPASHAGPAFVAKWDSRPLSELFEYLRSSMPKSDPGSLTRKEYIQVLAYLLKMNGMPAGSVELPADSLALKKIRMDLKSAGDPQPNHPPMKKQSQTQTLIHTICAIGVICGSQDLAAQSQRGNVPGEWRVWGADLWSTRYSPLDQINAENFNKLTVAWQWDASPFGQDEYYRTTPLYANGRLLTVATTRRIAAAIDPATGKTLWSWRLDEGIRWQKAPRQFAGRGLAYWSDGKEERAIVITPGYHLVSLDAKTGKPDPAFGKSGIVDLMQGLGLPLVPLAVDDTGSIIISEAAPARQARPGETWDSVKKIGADGTIGIDPALGQIASSSPALVVGDVIVVGNSSIHGYYPLHTHNVPGFVRGFDVHTGKQLWKFNLIPQAGEFGADTWLNGTKLGSPGVGKNDPWALYSADPELGLIYIPVGMPLIDEYGGYRPGNNLYSSSLVALDVKTGQRKWHYQFVHHDIWDYDTPMSPNLLDATVDGKPRKLVAQTTKQGWVYVLDRTNGQPIWPIVETPVLQSEVPGERTSPTQPVPSKPAPFAQQGLLESDLIDYTPAIKDSALKLAKRCRMGPYFIPAALADGTGASGYRCAWYAPGAGGGVNIDGGAAVDPVTGMLYVGSISVLSTIQVQKDPCSEFRYSSVHDSCGLLGALPPPPGYQAPAQPVGGFERRGALAQIGGISILKPKPLGGVTGYDLNTGDKKWWIPNGGTYEQKASSPLFDGVTLPPAPGRGMAQVIVTKTLVIYGTGRSGGVPDATPMLYAVDKATGKQVGAVAVPSRTTAVPMTFMHQGKQYIVFATGAGETSLVALRLP